MRVCVSLAAAAGRRPGGSARRAAADGGEMRELGVDDGGKGKTEV